jgi:hypothetical protein
MSVSTLTSTSLQCSICLEEVHPPLQKAKTSCRHTFHKICLEEWLKIGDSCPLCRHNLMSFVSFEQVTETVEKCRANKLSESEARKIWERFLKGIQLRTTEKWRIEKLRIEEIKKEYAELEGLDFRDDFSLMKLNLLKERIEEDRRKKKSNEDFTCMLIFFVAFYIFLSLPNAKPTPKPKR